MSFHMYNYDVPAANVSLKVDYEKISSSMNNLNSSMEAFNKDSSLLDDFSSLSSLMETDNTENNNYIAESFMKPSEFKSSIEESIAQINSSVTKFLDNLNFIFKELSNAENLTNEDVYNLGTTAISNSGTNLSAALLDHINKSIENHNVKDFDNDKYDKWYEETGSDIVDDDVFFFSPDNRIMEAHYAEIGLDTLYKETNSDIASDEIIFFSPDKRVMEQFNASKNGSLSYFDTLKNALGLNKVNSSSIFGEVDGLETSTPEPEPTPEPEYKPETNNDTGRGS